MKNTKKCRWHPCSILHRRTMRPSNHPAVGAHQAYSSLKILLTPLLLLQHQTRPIGKHPNKSSLAARALLGNLNATGVENGSRGRPALGPIFIPTLEKNRSVAICQAAVVALACIPTYAAIRRTTALPAYLISLVHPAVILLSCYL